MRLGNKLRLTSRHVSRFLPEHVSPCRQLEEVEQQLAEAYRSLKNIIIMLERRSSRWCAYRSLQTIIVMMEKMIKNLEISGSALKWRGNVWRKRKRWLNRFYLVHSPK